MLIQDWNSFYEQAESLYRNDPLKTRYVLKYIHKSGKLQLKVTDDRVVRPPCIKRMAATKLHNTAISNLQGAQKFLL